MSLLCWAVRAACGNSPGVAEDKEVAGLQCGRWYMFWRGVLGVFGGIGCRRDGAIDASEGAAGAECGCGMGGWVLRRLVFVELRAGYKSHCPP